MAPLMFIYNRSYQTPEQYSISLKSTDKINNQQSCAMKFSTYAKTQSSTRITNCTKSENVYFKGRLIGRKYCIPF